MGRAPPPEFHTLANAMFLNRGATHFSLGLTPCIISPFLLQIYLPPPLNIIQLRPCPSQSLVSRTSSSSHLSLVPLLASQPGCRHQFTGLICRDRSGKRDREGSEERNYNSQYHKSQLFCIFFSSLSVQIILEHLTFMCWLFMYSD